MSNKAKNVVRQVKSSQKPAPKGVDLRTIRAKNLELGRELKEYLAKFDGQAFEITDDTRKLSVAEFTQFLGELGNTVAKLELIRACMGDAAEWTAKRLDKSDIEVNAVSRSYDQGYEEGMNYPYIEGEEDTDEGDDESAVEEESESYDD